VTSTIQAFLAERPHKAGETVEYGWFVFRIVEAGQPPRIESLDFQRLASFTEDFSAAEHIHALQTETLRRFRAAECPCNLWQSALVSASYAPGHERAFLQRQPATDSNDSGWYLGILNDPLDMDDVASFTRRSLYELTIHDTRLAAFWLLPAGPVILLRDYAPAVAAD
jgi:hypothetical protein